MKILIGCPTLDHVAADFAMCLARLVATKQTYRKLGETRPIAIGLFHVANSNYVDARNTICDEALRQGVDKVLFLDSDMWFPADTVLRLAAHSSPIVGATYVTRNREGTNRVLGTGIDGQPLFLTTFTAPLVPVLDLPFGCMMVDTKVLEHLPRPWFRFPMDEWSTRSEDTYFCHKAREASYQVLCDTKLSRELGHIGTHIYRI